MAWTLGILFAVTLIFWLRREMNHRSHSRRLIVWLEARTQGRAAVEAPAGGIFAPLGTRLSQLADELFHSKRGRELAEANLQIILSSMQEGVVVVDSRHTIRLVNPSARKHFEFPSNPFGHPVLETLREPAVDEMIAAALATGAAQERELEISGRKPALVLAVRVSPMRDASGELGALAMFRDVTRLVQLEAVRQEFVANVSHELRTPLAIFQGYVENLVHSPEMERADQAQTFAILEKHSNRLNALVEDLLILARLEARSDEMKPEPLAVAAFVSEVARDWAIRVGKKGVTLKTDIAEVPDLSADRMRIEQVLSNLLDNALKYTPPGGIITIAAARVGGMVELSVADTGAGILSAALPHIFERFYRADKARSRELGGTGLGLSIVKHIAQAHGGSVGAESVYGKGTRIWVRLPAVE